MYKYTNIFYLIQTLFKKITIIGYKLINMEKRLESVHKRAVDVWGVESQMNMMTEEIGELLQAISKFRRSSNKSEEVKQEAYNHLCEEIADVENMINQFRYIFDAKIIDKYKEEKLERTLEKIIKSENEETSSKSI